MNSKAATFFRGLGILALRNSGPLGTQVTGATLSGTITEPAGTFVRSAKISPENMDTGQSIETQSNSAQIWNLRCGMPRLEAFSIPVTHPPQNKISNSKDLRHSSQVGYSVCRMFGHESRESNLHSLQLRSFVINSLAIS
jgi:hypothetical protein